jgi:hypothetical protein
MLDKVILKKKSPSIKKKLTIIKIKLAQLKELHEPLHITHTYILRTYI